MIDLPTVDLGRLDGDHSQDDLHLSQRGYDVLAA